VYDYSLGDRKGQFDCKCGFIRDPTDNTLRRHADSKACRRSATYNFFLYKRGSTAASDCVPVSYPLSVLGVVQMLCDLEESYHISYTRGDRTKEGLRVDLVDHPDNRVALAGFVNP